MAIFNSIMIPFEQAFRPAFTYHVAYARFNDLVDLAFVVDVVLMFFTSVIDSRTGKETFKPDKIAEKYMG